jgi:hypothetical protein
MQNIPRLAKPILKPRTLILPLIPQIIHLHTPPGGLNLSAAQLDTQTTLTLPLVVVFAVSINKGVSNFAKRNGAILFVP